MAIKLECVKTKHPQLHIESKFYKMMQGGGKAETGLKERRELEAGVEWGYVGMAQKGRQGGWWPGWRAGEGNAENMHGSDHH